MLCFEKLILKAESALCLPKPIALSTWLGLPLAQALPDDIRKEWINKIPLRRGGTVDEIASCAVFLASDMSSYISGQVIQVDGGMNM